MSEHIYRTIIENSKSGYLHMKVIKDENDIFKGIEIKDFNKAYEKLALAKKAYIKNKFIGDDVSKEELSEWERVFKKAENLGMYTVERYVKIIDTYFSLDIYSATKYEFYIIFNRLSKQQMKLSPIFRKSPFVAWIKDKNGVYVDANDKLLNLLNKTYDEVIGSTDYEINTYADSPKELANRLIEQDKDVMKNNELRTYEEIINTCENKKYYYETTKWPYISEESDIILGTIGIAFETTNKVELRKSIEKNEQTLFEIGNSIDTTIIIRDEDTLHYISPSFEKVYGVNPQELNLFENINAWTDYWDEIEFENEVEEYESNVVAENIVKIVKYGKVDKWLHTKFIPIVDEHGNKIKEIGIISDITDNKKIENELNKLRLDFFANLSHELRTPINLILSAIQVIDLRLYKLEDEDLKYFSKYLDILTQNGMRLLKLVNNLIDTTKLDSGNFDCNLQNNDIISCVENICMSVCEFVNTNNINIIFDTNVEEKIIAFDQDNIERIMLNLISNAIKFNKDNGEILITINYEDDIKISVKDTGIGIPIDKIKSIFGRFQQVNSKFKREKEGSGIGLSLVKSLVEMNGGSINVNSELGKGSEFVITLPDILVEENDDIVEAYPNDLFNVNKMNIEFSDIYT